MAGPVFGRLVVARKGSSAGYTNCLTSSLACTDKAQEWLARGARVADVLHFTGFVQRLIGK
jgi:hypothetical protein